MSRTIPRAYVTAAWNKNPVVAKEDAKKYCQELVKEGYLPLCPILAFDGIFSAASICFGSISPIASNKSCSFIL